MSRSRRKTPIRGIAGDSDKYDKRLANSRLRTKVKQILRTQINPDCLPKLREISNPWSMNKDGKRWFGYENYIYMRK